METIELRQTIRLLYEQRSLGISDCYRFSKIRKVSRICYQQADKESLALAEILQKHVENTHFQPVLLQAVNINLTANNYYLGWKEALKFVSNLAEAQQTLVICNSVVARVLLEFASIDEMSGKFNIPDYILDINEYKDEDITYWKKVPLNIATLKEQRAPYQSRSYKLVNHAVLLLSSLDYMPRLSALYAPKLETIILVNDCPNAPTWFVKRKTKQFKQTINALFPKMPTKQYTQAEFKTEISKLDSAIMFVPQNKSWWKYYASEGVFFEIDADDMSDMDDLGPMDFQAFCEDMTHFAETWPDQPLSQDFLKSFKRKKFNCLNRFIYWLRQ